MSMHWDELREEWQFLECKITILGTLIVVLLIAELTYSNFILTVSPINEYLFPSFISLIAIVPSVCLAVIGISTSGFSVKLARIYRGSTYFWYLIVFYTLTLGASGLGLLGFDKQFPILDTITLVLAGFGILYLMPFFLAMMRLMDARKVIEKLGRALRLESLILVAGNRSSSFVSPPDDPFLPLKEIGIRAIKEDDVELLQLVLDEFAKRYANALGALEKKRPRRGTTFNEVMVESIVTSRMNEVIDYFLNHMRFLKDIAIKEKNEQAVACDIEYFRKFAEETLNHRFVDSILGSSIASFKWVYEVFILGQVCLYAYFWDAAASAFRSLSSLSRAAIEKDYPDLQYSIAGFVKDLSTLAVEKKTPRYFLPNVSLDCASEVVRSRMVYGIYDLFLGQEIEDVNEISRKNAIEVDYFNFGPVLSRSYEKLIAVSFFDIYCEKGQNPEEVARIIWNSVTYKIIHFETLRFIMQNKEKRKTVLYRNQYSPKKALDDLVVDGLERIAEHSIGGNKDLYASEICSTLHELSLIPFKLKDEETIGELCDVFSRIYEKAVVENYRTAKIPAIIFSVGYAYVKLGSYVAAKGIVEKIKQLAISIATKQNPEQSMKVASLIGYLSAFSIDIGDLKFANEAIDELISFENEYSKIGKLPTITAVDLLAEQLEQMKSTFGFNNYYFEDAKGWLYRLFISLKIDFDLQKPIVSETGLTKFLSLYQSRKK